MQIRGRLVKFRGLINPWPQLQPMFPVFLLNVVNFCTVLWLELVVRLQNSDRIEAF